MILYFIGYWYWSSGYFGSLMFLKACSLLSHCMLISSRNSEFKTTEELQINSFDFGTPTSYHANDFGVNWLLEEMNVRRVTKSPSDRISMFEWKWKCLRRIQFHRWIFASFCYWCKILMTMTKYLITILCIGLLSLKRWINRWQKFHDSVFFHCAQRDAHTQHAYAVRISIGEIEISRYMKSSNRVIKLKASV